MLLEITRANGRINFKDVEDTTARSLDFSITVGELTVSFANDPVPDRQSMTIKDSASHQTISFAASEVSVPAGHVDFSTLRPALEALFFDVASLDGASLLAAITDETLPSGEWFFVTDRCDMGLWLFATSRSTVGEAGYGLFLNADFQTTGDYGNLASVTGVSKVGATSKWHIGQEQFTIDHDTPIGGTFSEGDSLDDGLAWQGVVLSVFGNTLTVVSNASDYPVGTVLDNGAGVTADILVVGTKSVQGKVFTYIGANMRYEHYQCVDDSVVDGTSPDVNTAAYTRVPRNVFIVGFAGASGPLTKGAATSDNGWAGEVVSVNLATLALVTTSGTLSVGDELTIGAETCDITAVGATGLDVGYNFISQDVQWDAANDWLQYREDTALSVKYRSTYLVWNSLGYNPIGSFPWGDATHYVIDINDGWHENTNSLADSVANIHLQTGSRLQGSFALGSRLDSAIVGCASSLTPYLLEGAALQVIEVRPDKYWEWTVEENSVISDMLVTQSFSGFFLDPRIYPTDTNYGYHSNTVVLEQSHFNNDIGASIAIASDYYVRFSRAVVTIDFSPPVTPFTGAMALVVKCGAVVVGSSPVSLVNQSLPFYIDIPLDMNQAGILETVGLTLTTDNGTNYGGGDPFQLSAGAIVKVAWL